MNPLYPVVAERAVYRCEYCHAPETVFNFPFEVEHILPQAHGGSDDLDNVALACHACNLFKSDFETGQDEASQAEAALFHMNMDATQEGINVMSQPIRAVYKSGQLWLLDPVHLTEGQEIRVLILSEEDRVRAALGDLVVPCAAPAEEDVDEEALAQEVEEGFRGQLPLSETIFEERRAGP